MIREGIEKQHEANMKQTHVLIALLLCLGFSDASLDTSPEIIGPDHIQLKAHLGTPLVIDCEAKPNCEDELTLIYWLVNGSFPQALLTSRISEMEELSSDGAVQRNLMLKNVTTEDLRSTFVCVVMNPVGVAKKHVTLRAHLDRRG